MSSQFRFQKISIRDVPKRIVDAATSLQNSPFTVVAEDQEKNWYILHYQDPDGYRHNNAYIAIGPVRYRGQAFIGDHNNNSYVDVATVSVMLFREQGIDPKTWAANELPQISTFLYFRVIPYITSMTVSHDVNYVCYDEQPITEWSVFQGYADDVYIYVDRYGFVFAVQPAYDEYRIGTPMITYLRRATPLNKNLTLTSWWVLFQDGMRITFQAITRKACYAYADVHNLVPNPVAKDAAWCGVVTDDSPNNIFGQVIDLGKKNEVVPFHGFVAYTFKESLENCSFNPKNKSTWSWRSYYYYVAYREWPVNEPGGIGWRGTIYVPPTTRSIIDGNVYIYFIPLVHEHNDAYGPVTYHVPRATFTVIDLAPIEKNEPKISHGDVVQLQDGRQYIAIELRDPSQNPSIFYFDPDAPTRRYRCCDCSPGLWGYNSNLPANFVIRYLIPYSI